MLIEMIGVGLTVDDAAAHSQDRKMRRKTQAFFATPAFANSNSDGGGDDARPSAGPGGAASAKIATSSALRKIDLQLRQGRVYAVVGAHAGGKTYFLRLLGKAMHPTCGEVFVPPHLSILHVEQDPQLFRHLSMYENLVRRAASTERPPAP